MRTVTRLVVAAALTVGPALLLGGFPAGASEVAASVSVNFTAAAMAPVMQVTEDEPTAQFHPEGEGDYGYSQVTASSGTGSALAAVMWPGAAAGNAGTLATILGAPPQATALNDPVQASATSGTSQTHSSITTPAGTAMAASVDPAGPSDQHAEATSTLAGGSLGGAGAVGSSSSHSVIDFDSDHGALSVTARSNAHDISIAGVVHVGSVNSSASAVATGGGTPTVSGSTTFADMTIAGNAVYVDGSGVHTGSPGRPAGPAGVDAIDAALAQAGMEVYFTAPHTVTVGGVAYYYSASVLFFWAPPGDTSHNSFTMSLGGAAVSVTDSADSGLGFDFGSTGGGSGDLVTPANSAPYQAAVPVTPSSGGAGGASAAGAPASLAGLSGASPAVAGSGGPGAGATLSLPVSPSAAAGTGGSVPASASLPVGIGAGWWVLAIIAGLAGAALTTRVPGLLTRQAAAVCPHSTRGRSSFGKSAANRRDAP